MPSGHKRKKRPDSRPLRLFNPARRYSLSLASTAFPRGRGDILAGTHETRQTDDSARRARAKIPVRIPPRL
jgi:hypothetical protein